MNKYDKIGIPLVDDKLSHHISWDTVEGSVIVFTLEEVRELWEYAHSCGEAQTKYNLESYLLSHNIEI